MASLFSNKFLWSEKEYHEAFDKLLDTLEIKSPFFLVVQVCISVYFISFLQCQRLLRVT